MAKIQFKAPVQKVLEINGKDYPIAQRTGALEKRIREKQAKSWGMSEYEEYREVIDIILGEGAFNSIFPDGENANLDNIAQVAFVAQQEFNAEKKALERKRIEEDVASMGLDKMIEHMKSFNKQSNQLMNNAAAAQNMKKGKK